MMFEVPLQATESQTITILLNNQNCQINIYQKSTGLYLDLFKDNEVIISTRLCVDRIPVVRNRSSGFVGELYFVDGSGTQNPDYLGLGTNFRLYYV